LAAPTRSPIVNETETGPETFEPSIGDVMVMLLPFASAGALAARKHRHVHATAKVADKKRNPDPPFRIRQGEPRSQF
jgi:hypothetical protein